MSEEKGKILTPGFRQGKEPTKKRMKNDLEHKVDGLLEFNKGIQKAFSSIVGKLTELESSVTMAFGYHDLVSLSIKDLLNEELGITEEKWNAAVEKISKMLNKKKEAEFDLKEGFKTVDRVVVDGDFVAFGFDGTVDGESFEGGSSNWTIVQAGRTQVLEDMDKSFIGKKAKDEYEVDVKFPDEYPMQKALEGKTATFKVKVIAVKEKIETPKLEVVPEEK